MLHKSNEQSLAIIRHSFLYDQLAERVDLYLLDENVKERVYGPRQVLVKVRVCCGSQKSRKVFLWRKDIAHFPYSIKKGPLGGKARGSTLKNYDLIFAAANAPARMDVSAIAITIVNALFSPVATGFPSMLPLLITELSGVSFEAGERVAGSVSEAVVLSAVSSATVVSSAGCVASSTG